jgi:hypothetical protein
MIAPNTMTTDGWSYYNRGGWFDWTAFTPGASRTGTTTDKDTAEAAARSALAELQANRP